MIRNLVNGSNFAKNSNFVFSEIVTSEEFKKLKLENQDLLIIRKYKYLKLDAIWYINPKIKLKENDVVFCHTEVVKILFKCLRSFKNLKNLKLITHESDKKIDKSLFAKKTSNISEWYSTNVDLKTDSLISLPIGVNNFYNKNNFDLNIQESYFKDSVPKEKYEQIFVNFTLNTNLKHRKKALNFAEKLDKKNVLIDLDKDVDKYYQNISKSKYTLAPWGNGIDTHRFWEALYMGSCPITLDHTHYSSFKNIPGIFLKTYSNINYEDIDNRFIEFNPNEIDYLKIDYWFKKINNYKINDSEIFEVNLFNFVKYRIFIFKLKIKIISLSKKIKYYFKRFLNLKNYFKFIKKFF